MATLSEEVKFFGHPMVRSLHRTTIEITKDSHLTWDGDCIIGVRADKGPSDLAQDLKEAIRRTGSMVRLTIEVPPEKFQVNARGSDLLTLQDPHEMVIRRSDFISDRTLAVGADKSARDVPRTMVEKLRSSDCAGRLTIEVEV